MTDDLRSTLEAAVQTEEAKGAATAAPSTPSSTDPTPTPPSDADTSVETGAPEGDKPGGESETSPENQPKGSEEGKESGEPQESKAPKLEKADKAPQSWKPAQREKWNNLDPDVRQEITRREREVTRVLSETASHRRFVDGFRKTVAPFTDRFRAANVAPERAIASLLYVDHTLATGTPQQRAEMMAKLIGDYQIDIEMLDGALSGKGGGDPVASRLESLLSEKLKPFQTFIEQTEQQKQEAVRRDFEQAQTTIQQMAEDTEKFPHFETVREDMADIIEINSRRGVYLSAEDAYNRAVKMNPEASAQAQEDAKRAQARKANEATQRSLGASLSVTGAPSGVTKPVSPTDLRGTIEAAFREASGR